MGRFYPWWGIWDELGGAEKDPMVSEQELSLSLSKESSCILYVDPSVGKHQREQHPDSKIVKDSEMRKDWKPLQNSGGGHHQFFSRLPNLPVPHFCSLLLWVRAPSPSSSPFLSCSSLPTFYSCFPHSFHSSALLLPLFLFIFLRFYLWLLKMEPGCKIPHIDYPFFKRALLTLHGEGNQEEHI